MRHVSPLYSPQFEHDACGIGAVVDLEGRKTYGTVDKALRIVEKLPGVRQLNELGGALAGLAKGLVLVCLALWVLCHTGVITPEMAEGSVVLGLLPGWIAGTGK